MLERGPGGNEDKQIVLLMRSGKSFEDALAEVAQANSFRPPQWWIEQCRETFIKEAGVVAPEPAASTEPPSKPQNPRKGKG